MAELLTSFLRCDSVNPGVRTVLIGSVFVAAVSVCRATPVSVQEQRPESRVVIGEILKAVDLTAEQKTAIEAIAQPHRRDAFQAARDAGVTVTVRQEMREALQAIVQVLTAEQREAAKPAFRTALAERQSR